MKFSDTTITFNPDFKPEMYVQIPRTNYWLKRYNDKEGRTQFDRSLRSLQSEWVEHTILYYVLYWNDYYRECARSADLDENRNGAYHCIFYDFY